MEKIKMGVFNPLPVAPVVLVGATVDGKDNFTTVAFVNGVNIKPAILYVSLNKNHHTLRGFEQNGSFSINIPGAESVLETDYCGLVSGKNVDKSAIFNTFYGELGNAPMIEEFPITCECRYTGQKIEFEMDVVYFGEVVEVYVKPESLSENGRIDVLKANPLYFSGFDNRYRALGADLGLGWSIGKLYRPKTGGTLPSGSRSEFHCEILERSAQPALTIRRRVSPVGLAAAIGQSAAAIYQYASGGGYFPCGPLFVGYRGMDGQELDVEIGFPFPTGVEGKNDIHLSEIPGGRAAVYRYIGAYDRLSEVRLLMERWLSENGYPKVSKVYEFYLNDPQTTAPEKLETEVVYFV